MENQTVVLLQSVSFKYGNISALNNLTLSIKKGEFISILGPNGGGKSTLFHLLSTLKSPSSGQVLIDGLDSVQFANAIRKKIGMVFQQPALDQLLTVKENLNYHGWMNGLSGQLLQGKITDLLAQFGITEKSEISIKNLSGGQKRRVELAKVLLTNPDILILDEATSGLDLSAKKEFSEFLTILNSTGKTIIQITHDPQEAEYSQRVLFLAEGQLVGDFNVKSLKADHQKEMIYIIAKQPQIFQSFTDPMIQKLTIIDKKVIIQTNQSVQVTEKILTNFRDSIDQISIKPAGIESLFFEVTGKVLHDQD